MACHSPPLKKSEENAIPLTKSVMGWDEAEKE